MVAELMTERERSTLEHLKQAQELGSTLTDYAAAYNLNVQDLYSGKAQLQRKGLWPSKSPADSGKADLIAVQVMDESASGDTTICRVSAPNGWSLEFNQWPDAKWLAVLMSTGRAA
jgi:hypothetical protein